LCRAFFETIPECGVPEISCHLDRRERSFNYSEILDFSPRFHEGRNDILLKVFMGRHTKGLYFINGALMKITISRR
jgi:hypothetical protein